MIRRFKCGTPFWRLATLWAGGHGDWDEVQTAYKRYSFHPTSLRSFESIRIQAKDEFSCKVELRGRNLIGFPYTVTMELIWSVFEVERFRAGDPRVKSTLYMWDDLMNWSRMKNSGRLPRNESELRTAVSVYDSHLSTFTIPQPL